jgi:uncharacterized protein DUF4203
MVPSPYDFLFAVVLIFVGAFTCFAGYRWFRIVLALLGFILGALMSSSVMGISNTAGMVIAALVGGLVGAAILLFAYFVGIALVGAVVGALIVTPVLWAALGSGDPPWQMVVVFAMAGAIGAMFVQRHVIIVTTALVGALTVILGIVAAADRSAVAARSATKVTVFYPTILPPGHAWAPYLWVVLGLAGTVVQMSFKEKKG